MASKFLSQQINPDRFHRSQWPFYAILLPLSLLMILPILFIFNHAFKPQSELFAYPPAFFVNQPTFDNFIELSRLLSNTGVPFTRYILNSILVTSVGVFLAIFFTALSAYGLAKLKFKGKRFLFEVNTIALMFVPIAVQIPRYLIVAQSGLTDQFFAHIFPVITLPVAMFLIKQFIDQIPNDFIEAARVDGASEMQIFLNIVIPMVMPAIATVGILAFQILWNDTSTSTLFFDDESQRTLAFFLQTLTATTGNTIAGQGMAAAASLIMFVPNLVLFVLLQSQVMSTMTHSGLK